MVVVDSVDETGTLEDVRKDGIVEGENDSAGAQSWVVKTSKVDSVLLVLIPPLSSVKVLNIVEIFEA